MLKERIAPEPDRKPRPRPLLNRSQAQASETFGYCIEVITGGRALKTVFGTIARAPRATGTGAFPSAASDERPLCSDRAERREDALLPVWRPVRADTAIRTDGGALRE